MTVHSNAVQFGETRRLDRVLGGAALALMFVAGCGGGGGGGGGTVLTGAVITGHIEVLGAPGSGVSGATVQLGARTATTNEQGWYIFSDVPESDRTIVHASATGYLDAFEAMNVAAGAAYHVDLVLTPAAGTSTVDAATGGSVTVGGIELTIPANAFVDASGAAATGAVTLTVATMDPGANTQSEDAFPGEFVGIGSDGMESPLESFGLFALEASVGDTQLALASGRTIGVRAPIAASGLATAPMTIALWSFVEDTARWSEEGTATRDGDFYTATLPHLSWWNFDRPYLAMTTCVRLCFVNGAGDPVPGVYVRLHQPAVRASMNRYTDSSGCTSIDVRASTATELEASYADGTRITQSFTTQDLITNTRRVPPMCQELAPLDIEPLDAQVMLSWGALPSDLDSHMTGPSATGRFHTYYGARGSLGSEPYCALDTDDTSAYGPEVITLHRASSGVYRYSVHNYSGQSAHPIESSGARVVVTVPELGQVISYDVPTANPANGDVWRVFDLHAEGGRVVDIVSIDDFAVVGSSSGPAYDP